jgi:IclR family KDG regulon transcriptional repressor
MNERNAVPYHRSVPMAPTRRPSPAVDRTLTLLETLVALNRPSSLTALAKRTKIPLATCATIMQTLEMRGYATRQVIGRSHLWRPTLRLYTLGAQLMPRLDLPQIAQPHLAALAEATGTPGHIGVLEGDEVVYVAKAAIDGFVQFNTFPGKRAPFNLTALGRAVAAFLDEAELQPLLGRLKTGEGPKARADGPRALLSELERVRREGYAVEDEEEEAGIACIAAPIRDAEGQVLASVGITGFARDLVGDRLDDYSAAVLRAARAISSELGHVQSADASLVDA